jgi:3-keto-5-aminohexanoate cleavage enzyme
VIGVGLEQWRLVAAAIGLDGGVRVGLEDNLYLEEGRMASSNGELVAKAVAMCHEQGREVASCAEARRLLELEEPR